MAQEVKLYHSGMTGAPSTTLQAAGAVVALLDACLVNGFNSVSITSMTRAGSVVTVNTAAAHGMLVGGQVGISGANETAYNDTWWVATAPTTTSLTFNIGAATPATPATGTMFTKTLAAGWTKPYTGTSSAIFLEGSGGCAGSVQVEENNPYADANITFRARMIATPSAFPDAGETLGEICKIMKNNGVWVLIADSHSFILVMNTYTFFCGRFTSLLSGDAYNFMMSRGSNATAWASIAAAQLGPPVIGQFAPSIVPSYNFDASSYCFTVLRDTSQLVLSPSGFCPLPQMKSISSANPAYGQDVAQTVTLPNTSDASVVMQPLPLAVNQAGGLDIRGMLRGLYWPLGQLSAGAFNAQNFVILDDITINGAVKKICLIRFGYNTAHQIGVDLGFTWAM